MLKVPIYGSDMDQADKLPNACSAAWASEM